eukprot:160119-Rhodomonas_salina.1
MSATDRALLLRIRSAIYGSEIGYAATHLLGDVRTASLICYALPGTAILQQTHYHISTTGTDIAFRSEFIRTVLDYVYTVLCGC